MPRAKSGRARTEIDDDIEQGSASTADQLGFERRCDLVMQTAHGATAAAEAHVGLQGPKPDALTAEFIFAPDPHESPPFVFMR